MCATQGKRILTLDVDTYLVAAVCLGPVSWYSMYDL